MVLLLIFSAVVLILIYWYIQWMHYSKHLKQFLGPMSYPIIGNAHHFYSNAIRLPNVLKFHKIYGGIVKYTIGFGSLRLSISDAKFLEFLLGSSTLIDKSKEYKFLNRWLGTGLLTGTGDKWRNHRKILTPAFHFQILEQVIDVFNMYSDILVEKLKPELNSTSTDIYPYITLCSLDIICASAMGTKVNAQKNTKSEYVLSVKEISRIIMERIVSVTKQSEAFYQLTNDYQLEKRALKVLHNTTNSVINLRKEQLQKKKDNESKIDDVGGKERKAFLDILLNYKEKYGGITDESIREEVDTFMFEGHDTTSSGITFTLYCLAKNANIQEKVIEELVEVFDNNFTRQITYNDLQKMKYLEMVIKESLRMYPPVPLYSRNVREDTIYDGKVMPKNLTLMINAFSMHRDPKWFPNPERFDPERFNHENQSKRSPYAYIPFSAGSRNCIGQKFAILEMKAVITKVLIKYELLPSIPDIELVLLAELILKSDTGVHIRLKPRKF